MPIIKSVCSRTLHCRSFAGFLLLCTIFFVHTATAASGGLPRPVQTALQAAQIPLTDVAIWVQAVDGTAPAVALNATQAMNPASVMKLVTAFAALDTLGPAYTWTTRISSTGTLKDGVLDGDLHLVGGADPVLSYERLWKLLRQVRALGVATIQGDIVLDSSALRLPLHDPDAFDGRGLRPYNSGPYGMLLHFNTLQLSLQPATQTGAPVGVVSSPPVQGLTIDNRMTTAAGPCGAWHRNLDAALETTAAGPRLILLGGLPASCGQRNWSASPLPPDAFSAAVVAALWTEIGGTLHGTVRTGAAPTDAALLVTDSSPALAEVVREMNKWSSNVIARQLLATLGQREPGALDMVAAGAMSAATSLLRAGIETTGLVIENGSGLSRIDRIRADSLGALLLAAWQRPFMPEFISALPMAGIDGTAHRRLGHSPARGRAHIKTGTINNVRAMGGYVLDRNGRRHAVVMMVNGPGAHNSQAAQDALIEWVWEGH